MRTISDEQERLIGDAIGELSLSLSPSILEKDILVTEALRAISKIDLPGLTVTFSGGTCLAKAYQILERMSEDIDLRLLIDNQESLTRSTLRRTLSELKTSLAEAFRTAQFGLPEERILARNENHFISFDLAYATRYPPEAALRPDVRIEFVAIPPRRPTQPRTFPPLLDKLTQRTTASPVTLECLSIEETYCEKIIAYLRRATEHLAGRENSQYEGRLARHVYDVHQIVTLHYQRSTVRPPQDLFGQILAGDVEQYGNRIEGFRADPAGTLRQTLDEIPRRREFREHYDRFVAELVYSQHRPTFDEAFATFQSGAEDGLVGYIRRPPDKSR
jgi:predicted nucleotidyltransferase component of viral defense system